MSYIQYSILIDESVDAELLIARLVEAGFEGLEERENEILAFAGEGSFDEGSLKIMLQEQNLRYSRIDIPEQNWNEVWEKEYHPIIVDDFCAIRAAFHEPISAVEHDLIITPKMSFGTGHHATTFLMITAMRGIDFFGRDILDFGTGTGILSILAEKMGAGNIIAVDNDDWSIENANENKAINRCSNITVQKRDSTDNLGIFDIVLANITKLVLIENLPGFWQHLRSGGVLILSGFFKDDEEEMKRMAELNQMRLIRQYQQQEWICLVLKNDFESIKI